MTTFTSNVNETVIREEAEHSTSGKKYMLVAAVSAILVLATMTAPVVAAGGSIRDLLEAHPLEPLCAFMAFDCLFTDIKRCLMDIGKSLGIVIAIQTVCMLVWGMDRFPGFAEIKEKLIGLTKGFFSSMWLPLGIVLYVPFILVKFIIISIPYVVRYFFDGILLCIGAICGSGLSIFGLIVLVGLGSFVLGTVLPMVVFVALLVGAPMIKYYIPAWVLSLTAQKAGFAPENMDDEHDAVMDDYAKTFFKGNLFYFAYRGVMRGLLYFFLLLDCKFAPVVIIVSLLEYVPLPLMFYHCVDKALTKAWQ